MTDKIIAFSVKNVLFSDEQKAEMSDSIKEYTSHPDLVISTIEAVLCKQLVLIARELGANLGKKIATLLVKD